MVDSVIDKQELLVIPREKKKTFLWNLPFYFFLERDSVQVSKYSMVTGVYPSHICFKGHHGITIEVSRDLKDRIEQYINK